MNTPWGQSQGSNEAAPGIVFYHTAGHGGFHLSAGRMAQFRQTFPWFETFAGGPWFEEDCDYCVVVLAFGDTVFNDEQIRGAVRGAQCSASYGEKWLRVSQWLDNDPEGRRLSKIAIAFEVDRAAMWERGGLGGGGFRPEYNRFWSVNWYRGGCKPDAEHRTVMMPDYPTSNWITDDEISGYEEFSYAKHYPDRKPMAAALMPTLVGSSCGEDECHSDADPGL
jgi:hypothetical protein